MTPKQPKPQIAPAPAAAKVPQPVQSARGMRDIVGKEYYEFQGFMEKAAEVAIYYGFKPIETPILEKTETFTSGLGETSDILDKEMYTLRTKSGDQLAMRPEGTAAVMRAYMEHGMQSWPQPVMLYYSGPFFRHDRPQKGRYREFYQFGLEMMGLEKSIADTMIIKIMLAILDEAGIKNGTLEINSIGDKVCRPGYKKALTIYYKKHQSALCNDCKNRLKDNPLRLLDCKEEGCIKIKEGAPDSMAYLCEPCKQHFKEVLESLEALDIEYQLNKNLVRGLDYYTRTVFEITAPMPEEKVATPEVVTDPAAPVVEVASVRRYTIASGGRYDYLAKQLGSKKDVPSVGGAIGVDRVLLDPGHTDLTPRIVKKPKIFFIQLGFEAKLKSMTVIEILRKARVPVAHSLSKDGLGAQLGNAERLQIPYAIILGQKEVIDETVIVRNMETRSQETVKIEKLAEYVKTHIK